MFAVVGINPQSSYPILLILVEIFGLLSVIFAGLLFDYNFFTGKDAYNWEKNPFTYHPLLMTIGLLFCYGNAILLYRTFRDTSKFVVKVFHAILLVGSLAFGAAGLAAIIRSKNLRNASHFMTYHSWIGLTTIILFVFQWIVGFVCFLFPQLSLDIRRNYMAT
jgi:cytochrome b-561